MKVYEQRYVNRVYTIHSFHSAFDYNWSDSYSFEGEYHNFWEVVYVVSGAVDITEDDRIYQLTQGHMLIHAPMEFHNICSANGTSPHVLILSFAADGTLPDNLTDGSFLLSLEMGKTYERLFEQAKAFVDNPKMNALSGQEALDRLSAFLMRLSRRYTAESPLLLSRPAMEYARLVDAMNTHICDNLTTEEFARFCNISVSYMKQLFSRFAGVGPKVYYSRLRCSESIRLLQEGFPVAQIAERLNFSSVNYFSDFFKRMTGVSPSRYMHENVDMLR